GLQNAVDQPIARLFDPGSRSSVEQDASRQVECLLRPAHDHDLFGFAANATRSSDISGDSFSQVWQSHRIPVLQCLHAHAARITRDQLQPNFYREFVQVRLADLEGTEAFRPRRSLVWRKGCSAGRNPPLLPTDARRILCSLCICPARKRTRDKRAGADAALEISLSEKLRIRGQDGQSRDARLARELTRRWNKVASAKFAANPPAAERIVNLLIKGLRHAAVDGDEIRNAPELRFQSGYTEFGHTGHL